LAAKNKETAKTSLFLVAAAKNKLYFRQPDAAENKLISVGKPYFQRFLVVESTPDSCSDWLRTIKSKVGLLCCTKNQKMLFVAQ
jgi:hypothetical protein